MPPRVVASLTREANGDISAKQIERNGSEKIESLAFRSSNPCTRSRAARSLFQIHGLSRLLSFYPADRCLSDRTRKHYFHPSQPGTSGLISHSEKKRSTHLEASDQTVEHSLSARDLFQPHFSAFLSRLHRVKGKTRVTDVGVNLNAVLAL